MGQVAVADRPAAALGLFERYLTLWVALCIVAGIVLGSVVSGLFQALGAMSVANVNIPVAILIWLMIVPMLLRVDFAAIGTVTRQWRGMESGNVEGHCAAAAPLCGTPDKERAARMPAKVDVTGFVLR